MGDMERRKWELEAETGHVARQMKKLKRQPASGGQVKISKAQQTAARALMVMRNGEPTAAMEFLRSKKGPAQVLNTDGADRVIMRISENRRTSIGNPSDSFDNR